MNKTLNAEKNTRPALIAAALGLALAFAGTIATVPADAASEPLMFCVESHYGDEPFTAKHGGKLCEAKADPFVLEGSADGVRFDARNSKALPFSLSVSNMKPGDTRYGLYSVRTGAASPAASVKVNAVKANAEIAGGMVYGARVISGTTCNASTFAFARIEAVPANSGIAVSSKLDQALSGSSASTVNYCFAVSRPASSTGSVAGDAAWALTAVR